MEGKVFGIGAESCTIGSHEFYLAYAQKNGIEIEGLKKPKSDIHEGEEEESEEY